MKRYFGEGWVTTSFGDQLLEKEHVTLKNMAPLANMGRNLSFGLPHCQTYLFLTSLSLA
jgi:hypothetical protein